VALEKFLVGPDQDIERENDLHAGEILTHVILPPPRPGTRSMHLRQGETDSFDWPIADVAVVLELATDGICRQAAVVLGAAAPVPYRAQGAQSALAGKRISEALARSAAQAALAGAAPLAHNAYKLPVFAALVRRAILGAAGQA
jgi:xanthine dehydrogenase YagS FAD-binding subunit